MLCGKYLRYLLRSNQGRAYCRPGCVSSLNPKFLVVGCFDATLVDQFARVAQRVATQAASL
jgi:hypothetical protein